MSVTASRLPLSARSVGISGALHACALVGVFLIAPSAPPSPEQPLATDAARMSVQWVALTGEPRSAGHGARPEPGEPAPVPAPAVARPAAAANGKRSELARPGESPPRASGRPLARAPRAVSASEPRVEAPILLPPTASSARPDSQPAAAPVTRVAGVEREVQKGAVLPDWPSPGEVDHAARPRWQIRPEYPARARRSGRESTVVVEAWVDEVGAVAFASVLRSGGEDFDESARRAVRRSSFQPARRAGQAVASRVALRIHFELYD